MKPLCFVLMPFGTKSDAEGNTFQFDKIYQQVIKPAVEAAGMEPIRADEEKIGGIIHKPMFERLILCEYAVADLTTANANVYYELGIRHASRPYSTVMLFAEGNRIPFDLGPVRGCPYPVEADGSPSSIDATRTLVTTKLQEAKANAAQSAKDNPVFQLLDQMEPPDISHIRTDIFRDSVDYAQDMKSRLATARKEGIAAIEAVQEELGTFEDTEAGIVVDLLLSYRATSAWPQMVTLVEAMPETLRRTVLIREQYAFALNRYEQSEEAEKVLLDLIKERGPSSETYGLLGRVYKDRWENTLKSGNDIAAKGYLKKAIDAYLKGFQTDWRDAYPGINAATLMEIADPPDERRKDILPVVTYSCRRRIENGEPDYWDHATLLELAVLAKDITTAEDTLCDALAAVRESWEPETTARNLRLIQQARENRGENTAWEQAMIDALANGAT